MNPTDLDAAWLALSADGSDPGNIRLAALDAANDVGNLYIACDSRGRLHLLAPVRPGHPVPSDHRSKGVGIERSEYVIGGKRTPFVDVICFETELDDIFRRLSSEMVSAILIQPENSVAACQRILSRWRQMLDRRRPPLGADALAGLFGELTVLRRFVGRDPARRITSWVGPKGSSHDFQNETLAVEVKTTLRREGRFVEIHGLEQLEPLPGRDLYLYFVRLRTDDAGISVADLVTSVKAAGADPALLDELVAGAGWEPSEDEGRFGVMEERLYRVDDSFPKVVPASFLSGGLPEGVLRLRYEVDLTGSHPKPLDAGDVEAVLDALAGLP